MKKLTFLLSYCILFFSCEEVVDIDLPEIEPKLVVEADIIWEKNTSGNVQAIRLSESADFFAETGGNAVETATVLIRNMNTGEEFVLTHESNGIYKTDFFLPRLNHDYELTINYDNLQYTATEKLFPVADLVTIEQNTAEDFEGEEVISVDAIISDPEGEENYYHVIHDVNNESRPFVSIWDDRFQDGNNISIIYREYFTDSDDQLQSGDNIEITISGVSEEYANYMLILTEQFYQGGDPFSTVPVELKGNVFDENNQRVFGYFRLSEAERTVYNVQ